MAVEEDSIHDLISLDGCRQGSQVHRLPPFQAEDQVQVEDEEASARSSNLSTHNWRIVAKLNLKAT